MGLTQRTYSKTAKHSKRDAQKVEVVANKEKHAFFPTGPQAQTLVEYHHLPEWYKDNEFIVTGYRMHGTMTECFQSVFSIHNESGNIWTHVIGFFLFLYIFINDIVFWQDTLVPVREITDESWKKYGDWIVFSVYLLSVKACLMFSSLYHIVLCHSHDAFRVYSKLDYAGIAFLISGSFYPLVYYWFYCRPHLQFVYLCLISFFGLSATYLALSDKFATREYRTFRAAIFTATGFTGGVPALHFYFFPEDSLDVYIHQEFPFFYFMIGVVAYLSGAVIYSQRIPERLFVGKFDYWLHSHQIFHILVVIGAFAHYLGCHEALRWNSMRMCSVDAHDIY
eukprot:TRINITY_DN11451_c0_g1_i1.p1 TRINITY_DN11451_c0_g1~~TRINITY_DN11451_c0_g1_i1.p1  ORF type:complete len:337 (+),score=59.27 TRINITY_DN11451_c0_g1_i1:53-1063(+)